jgi:hypothetical protein
MTAQRWSTERAARWQTDVGWLVGCNFTPSTAGNQLEMWQSESFDPETIDRELGWASDLGMNVVRVYLHDLLFEADGNAFLARIDEVLAIAHRHGIGMMPVLFDGVWHPKPKLGAQPDPVPRLHNSIWVQSPGNAILQDRSQWPALKPYVTGVLSRFAADERIIAWDLFNEPDQIDQITIAGGSRDEKAAAATELLVCVFDWAREVDPSQPLTAGVWEYDSDHRPVDNPINAVMLERSDVITFHCYEPRAALEAVIQALSAHGRPLVCTEWLARTAGSSVDLLEVFAEHQVGAINWGLVDGRTQTRFPWRSWFEAVDDDEPWFHELLHADGSPYDPEETATFRRVTGNERA